MILGESGQPIRREFKIGDRVWFAEVGSTVTWKTCPICCGTGVLTVILGDKSEVEVGCETCSRPYGANPKGQTLETVHHVEPRQMTVTGVERREETGEAPSIRYHLDWGDKRRYADQGEVFEAWGDASVWCHAKSAALEAEELDRAQRGRSGALRTLSFNLGYWRAHIKKLRQEIERYEGFIRTVKDAPRVVKP